MRRQRPGHRILSFHHRGLLLLAAAVAVMLFFLYGCMAGAAYSPRGRLVFIPLAQVSGSRTTSLFRFYLEESKLPTAWYNVRADMKNKPAPLLNPGTLKPMTARELDGVFCDELVQQELDDTTAYILSQLYHDGLMEATSVEQTSVFEAAEQFALPGEQPCHPRRH